MNLTFWDIYKIGMLAAAIRTVFMLFGDPKQTGWALNVAVSRLQHVLSERAAKWSLLLMVIFMLGLLVVIWPISLPWSIWMWFIHFKHQRAEKAKKKGEGDKIKLKDF